MRDDLAYAIDKGDWTGARMVLKALEEATDPYLEVAKQWLAGIGYTWVLTEPLAKLLQQRDVFAYNHVARVCFDREGDTSSYRALTKLATDAGRKS